MVIPSPLDGVRGVVVDWDGTVADNTLQRHHALARALEPHGIDLPGEWYLQHAGLPVRDLIQRLSGGRHLPVEDIVATSRRTLMTGPAPAPIQPTLELGPSPRVVDTFDRPR